MLEGGHGGVGVDLGVVGMGGYPGWGLFLLLFTWRCFASKGSCLPSVWARFLGFNSFLALALLALCLKK